ncbi:MAG: aminomethyl-transferring glycine dehydrogenase [Bacteroidales bacterium]|nr:aminomethyl-transferring glycine dehydrogenase [Bacteroidales bacterium]MDT8430818.1 aminomethyl-transferring glycine dehydrogenase [Bacteroidales bacterium]
MRSDKFSNRHIGPRGDEITEMLQTVGAGSLDELVRKTIPGSILSPEKFQFEEGISEAAYLDEITEISKKNKIFRSFIGQGYYNTELPSVIRRNMLENPNWYTSYTPYQAEISQGRMEALLNFQTVITELTGMELANASLLDEASAASEAMIMMYNSRSRADVKANKNEFFIDRNIFPQTMDLLRSKAVPLGIEIATGDFRTTTFSDNTFGCMVQYPAADGKLFDFSTFATTAREKGIFVGVAADIMALILLTPPGSWGADVVFGSTQRLGIPMFYGGPHAAYFATTEAFKRQLPGRIIGVSVDIHENPALRMALQTREQHIKRERATSNICTAQALLANMAGMFAVYHGPDGLRAIAEDIHTGAVYLDKKLTSLGYSQENECYFDTLKVNLPEGITATDIRKIAVKEGINFFYPDEKTVLLSTDETVREETLNDILGIFAVAIRKPFHHTSMLDRKSIIPVQLFRTDTILEQEVFHKYRSETDLMRYMRMLERRDISLTQSMISLGSCTMKLNAATQLIPVSFSEFANIHPFVPMDQVEGYYQLMNELSHDLERITGFEAVSLQPNSGATGEYTGMMVIRAYHENRGEGHRNIVLIPASAHGTNPASGVMAGMTVKVVPCDEMGNIDTGALREMAEAEKDHLAAIMITYPSTHGVFEENIMEIIDIVHENGGQVYMDGANMNAQVGLTNPAIIGADVCHLNLHKTFAIPHGGGGPGVGPIGVAKHLVEFLPTHPIIQTGGVKGINAVAAAPFGSAGILPISHAYIKMLGKEGLTDSTRIAILNANYLAVKLKDHYKILYKGKNGFVAHEMIIDCRGFKADTEITETDIAKRLMDYGFHAPTLSFPVHGTLMVEPAESESKAELDRFADAMIDIASDIRAIREGKQNKTDNALKNAPHTQEHVVSEGWTHPYTRQRAAFPLEWVGRNKFWPYVGRINDVYGDRNLVCTCDPISSYFDQPED